MEPGAARAGRGCGGKDVAKTRGERMMIIIQLKAAGGTSQAAIFDTKDFDKDASCPSRAAFVPVLFSEENLKVSCETGGERREFCAGLKSSIK